MTPFFGELIGTCLLVVLGDGVVANVVLSKTKGNNSGWLVITLGWGVAVFVGVYAVSSVSGAHINPAATIALAAAGKFAWGDVPTYRLGRLQLRRDPRRRDRLRRPDRIRTGGGPGPRLRLRRRDRRCGIDAACAWPGDRRSRRGLARRARLLLDLALGHQRLRRPVSSPRGE